MRLEFTREKIWIALVGFTVCSFAFSERINSWGIILLILFFLADKNLIKKIRSPFQSKKLFPFLSFVAVYLVFFLISEKDNNASHSLVSKLSLVLLPILFSYETYFNPKNEKVIIKIFSIFLTIGFLYGLFSSLYTNYLSADTPAIYKALSRMQISRAIMHPGYFSNYFMLGILWHYYNTSKFRHFFIIIFSIALLLLLSRIVLLFYILFIGFAMLRHIIKSKSPIQSTAIIIAFVVLGALLILQVPTVKSRVNETISGLTETSNTVDYSSATASRSIAYQAEWNIIKQEPLTGYGLGNAVKSLQQELRSTGYINLAKKMHIHNQYFNTWLQTGIFGLLALLILISSLFRYFYQKKIWVAFWFTILVAMNLLTDDMLEIQAGIVFFALVWSLYLFRKKVVTRP